MKYFNTKSLVKLFGISILLCLWEIITNRLFGVESNLSQLHYWLISNLLIVFLLGFIAINSNYHGLRLSFRIWLVFACAYLTIMVDSAMMENFTFHVIRDTVLGILTSLALAPLIVYVVEKWNGIDSDNLDSPKERFSILGWVWRLLVGDIAYFIIAGIAGIILFSVIPGINEFYADKLPPMELMLSVHFFIRIPIMMIAIILLLSTLNTSSKAKILVSGLTLSILLGLSPLIRPVEALPDYIRYGHLVEASASLFVFGLVLAIIFIKPFKSHI